MLLIGIITINENSVTSYRGIVSVEVFVAIRHVYLPGASHILWSDFLAKITNIGFLMFFLWLTG